MHVAGPAGSHGLLHTAGATNPLAQLADFLRQLLVFFQQGLVVVDNFGVENAVAACELLLRRTIVTINFAMLIAGGLTVKEVTKSSGSMGLRGGPSRGTNLLTGTWNVGLGPAGSSRPAATLAPDPELAVIRALSSGVRDNELITLRLQRRAFNTFRGVVPFSFLFVGPSMTVPALYFRQEEFFCTLTQCLQSGVSIFGRGVALA